MKKIRLNILSLILISMSLVGCEGFLNVNPKGEVFDNDMFTSAEGYEDALYGIYAELGTTQYLYSDYMFWLPEVLSANIGTTHTGLGNMQYLEWSGTGAPAVRSYIWQAAYKTINHINNILAHIETGGEDEFPHSKLYKGEALGLRAMLHFDMLRLYGAPVWADEAKKAKAIPYVSKYSFAITPFSSVDAAYELILKDLKEAESLLTEDESLLLPVRNNASSGGFTSCRIIHMNLYAVQALIARVYWSKNDLENAAVYAQKVISSGKFKFRPTEAFVQADNGTLDLNETIFGLYSTKSNSNNASAYGLKTSSNMGFTLNSDWTSLYDDGSSSTGSDLRLSAWFDNNTYKNLVNRTFIEGDSSYTGSSILGVSLLRISELYYIMAESLMQSNPAGAAEYYNAVAVSRALDAIDGESVKLDEDMLYRERRKEFYGEGLHWFDMKRLGKDIKVAPSVTHPGNNPDTFIIPRPLAEDENRNE